MRAGALERTGTWCGRLILRAVVACSAVAADVVPAEAALTTPACIAQKIKAWGRLRSCQRAEEAKLVEGKRADLTKCQTKFQRSLAVVGARAAAAGIACRFRDNGDLTVTDFDTGLMWERKNFFIGPPNPFDPHHPRNLYTWSASGSAASGTAYTDFLSRLNSCFASVGGGTVLFGGFAGHCDWRLPTVVELRTLEPIPVELGPTAFDVYWSSTSAGNLTFANAWFIDFGLRRESFASKTALAFVRAVRDADL